MPGKIAFLFPGQGRVPDALPENSHRFSDLLEMMRDAGLSLTDWIGDPQLAQRLSETNVAQPTLFLDSLCRAERLDDAGWTPHCVAGHSLGEFAALVRAGVLDARDAMRVVLERGRLMQKVRGSMAAILKLDLDAVVALCKDTQAVVANHNAPQQIVVSGPCPDVELVTTRAEAAGGRAIPLKVSGPFHSPLMASAEHELAPLLCSRVFSEPSLGIVSSVSGRLETDAGALKQLILRQMTSSVRWVDVTQVLEELGIDTAIEVGSGDVLTRLGRRSDASIRFLTYEEAMHERSS